MLYGTMIILLELSKLEDVMLKWYLTLEMQINNYRIMIVMKIQYSVKMPSSTS